MFPSVDPSCPYLLDPSFYELRKVKEGPGKQRGTREWGAPSPHLDSKNGVHVYSGWSTRRSALPTPWGPCVGVLEGSGEGEFHTSVLWQSIFSGESKLEGFVPQPSQH